MTDRAPWLLPVEPIGVGTPMVESMSGYVLRLAWRHFLAPSRLARFVLADALGRPNVVGLRREDWGKFFSKMFRNPDASLNGRGVYAREWVETLERLTGLRGLGALTMLGWEAVLPNLRLLSATVRFCPACVAGFAVPYEPLLWQLQSVEVCAIHRARLLVACPHCSTTRGILGSWARPGWCTNCHRSLAGPAGPAVPRREWPWHRFVYEQVGSLLATTPPARPTGQPPVFASVQSVLDAVSLGHLTRFAQRIRMHVSTVSLWHHTRRLPTLDASLRVAYVGGVDLVDLLTGSVGDIRPRRRAWLPPSPEHRRNIDWDGVGLRLRAALNHAPPPALYSIARAAEVAVGEMKRHYPAECRALVAAHGSARRAAIGTKRSSDLRRLRETIDELHAKGRRPSKWFVERMLGDVSLRDPPVQGMARPNAGAGLVQPGHEGTDVVTQ